jgi:diguanylate cyclase (GGDEF)-like protein
VDRAAQALTSLRDSRDVVVEGTRMLAELAGLAAPGRTRVAYLRVADGVVTEEVVSDGRDSAPVSYLLRDDPYVTEVVEAGVPLATALDRTAMGPTLRYVTDESGVTHAAFVPVEVGDVLHGILRLDGRGAPISEEVFARCRALGDVVEVALGNAIAHEKLEHRANSDALTGLANRRGLALYLDGERGRDALGILVMDIDGLEAINDAYGHDTGDRILVAVARAVAGTLRGGDLVARTGGDELIAVVTNADASDTRRVAERVTAAVSGVEVHGVRTSVSVGYASCGKNGDPDRARRLASQSKDAARRMSGAVHGRHHPGAVADVVVPRPDGCRPADAGAGETVVVGEFPDASL